MRMMFAILGIILITNESFASFYSKNQCVSLNLHNSVNMSILGKIEEIDSLKKWLSNEDMLEVCRTQEEQRTYRKLSRVLEYDNICIYNAVSFFLLKSKNGKYWSQHKTEHHSPIKYTYMAFKSKGKCPRVSSDSYISVIGITPWLFKLISVKLVDIAGSKEKFVHASSEYKPLPEAKKMNLPGPSDFQASLFRNGNTIEIRSIEFSKGGDTQIPGYNVHVKTNDGINWLLGINIRDGNVFIHDVSIRN